MKRLFFLLITLLLVSCTGNAQQNSFTKEDQRLRNEIGQMLIVGFRGTSLNSDNHILRDISQYNIGGVILFEYDAPSGKRPRNITSAEQLRSLCSRLQKSAHGTLLIGIDQEGGRVSRLKEKYGFPAFASAQKSANDGDDSVRYYAQLTAKTLKNLGINLNFAPCVDVNINPDCPVIGKIERSFSADPATVAHCAKIWVDEQQRQGVTACLKHFPGHGSSKSDTHLGLADVTDTWQPTELLPYRRLIANSDVRMVMTTHVFNAQIDSLSPATLSYPTLTTLLRDSLNFQGVIITDDLAMGAMVDQYEYSEILMRTILAGADLLCLSNNGKEYNDAIVPQTVDIIYNMVKEGTIPAERIHQSVARIRNLKETMGLAK